MIHFARSVLPPGTDRLVFLSKSSNGWEGCLEELLKSPKGLTAIWSNTEGLPGTRLLFYAGDALTCESR